MIPSSFPGWVRTFVPPANKFIQMIEKTVWENELNGRFEQREETKKVFLQRIEAVKTKIPRERLLVHEAKDGWDPLCRFLNVPVPDHDYPWVNEGRQIRMVVRILKVLNWLPTVLLAGGVGLLLYLV